MMATARGSAQLAQELAHIHQMFDARRLLGSDRRLAQRYPPPKSALGGDPEP